MPTNKAKPIEDILTSMAGMSRQKAAIEKVCVWCKEPLTKFRDALSEKEYLISGLCQSCQDETFGVDNE